MWVKYNYLRHYRNWRAEGSPNPDQRSTYTKVEFAYTYKYVLIRSPSVKFKIMPAGKNYYFSRRVGIRNYAYTRWHGIVCLGFFKALYIISVLKYDTRFAFPELRFEGNYKVRTNNQKEKPKSLQKIFCWHFNA